QSEHVARVFDVGTFQGEGLPSQGVPFMVMEFLTGQDLGQWVKQGKRFSASAAIGFVMQASEALAQAHKLGIVHRDIKPANLFLVEREAGTMVKVLDFGISKLTAGPDDLGLTKTTTVLGSGLYMSPEQMRSAKSVDHRTDVYSLGVCLYELLTGTQPYTASNFPELCVKVATEPPTPLRQYRPDISAELADAIAKAYNTDIDARYQTVQEMATALAPFATAQAVSVASEVQKITKVHPSGAAAAPMHGTSAPLSASVARDVTKSSGWVWGIAAAVIAVAGAGGFFLSRRASSSSSSTPSAVVGAASASAAPTLSASASAAPTLSASASAAPTLSASAAPTLSASASAAPTLSASAAVLPPPPRWRPPRPPAVRPPPPPPPKLCSQRNPDTGLFELVPCKR
ncbi:MAG TPA: serine/threonine protein kinase, partial [Sorangium sp.]|nr:serine/threonine protein kinase [Sorangium sp.]